MHIAVYGGQYGSEGKGSVTEWLAKQRPANGTKPLVVAGENSPNSGHTNTIGKTRNIPAASYFADAVLIGPDAVIDYDVLKSDVEAVIAYRKSQGKPVPTFFIHHHAALVDPLDASRERDLVQRVGSTGTGSGAARASKYIARSAAAVIKGFARMDAIPNVKVVTTGDWLALVDSLTEADWLFEASQGMMLDTNFGVYPYVTSRSTSPRVAIERNGFGGMSWEFAMVARTYPIRTGGNSGPCTGAEVSWESLGLPAEIATVTKRVRRVFEFSPLEYSVALDLSRPHHLFFTHVDYILSTFGSTPAEVIGAADNQRELGDAFAGFIAQHQLQICLDGMPVWISGTLGSFHSFAESRIIRPSTKVIGGLADAR